MHKRKQLVGKLVGPSPWITGIDTFTATVTETDFCSEFRVLSSVGIALDIDIDIVIVILMVVGFARRPALSLPKGSLARSRVLSSGF